MLIASAVYVSAEVLGRRFFGFSLGGANEMSSYALAIPSSAWAFSYAVYERAHIRIDAAYQNLARPAVRAFIDVLSLWRRSPQPEPCCSGSPSASRRFPAWTNEQAGQHAAADADPRILCSPSGTRVWFCSSLSLSLRDGPGRARLGLPPWELRARSPPHRPAWRAARRKLEAPELARRRRAELPAKKPSPDL